MSRFVISIILKEIRPLNIQEIQRLLSKNNKTVNSIQGQDIVLLIGSTGSGKSTTIQVLAGGNMKLEKVEMPGKSGKYLDHVRAVPPFPNQALKEIISSPFAKSETKNICPIMVTLPNSEGNVWLVDAPGYGDTGGPEVDITNSVGLISALQKCKSMNMLCIHKVPT